MSETLADLHGFRPVVSIETLVEILGFRRRVDWLSYFSIRSVWNIFTVHWFWSCPVRKPSKISLSEKIKVCFLIFSIFLLIEKKKSKKSKNHTFSAIFLFLFFSLFLFLATGGLAEKKRCWIKTNKRMPLWLYKGISLWWN